MERKARTEDSIRNCRIRIFFSEPAILRILTSLARSAERAVVRLIKLTHDKHKDNNSKCRKKINI